MSAIDSARAQHAELLALASQVSAALGSGPHDPVSSVHDALLRLTGRLAVHLAAEDDRIYPILRRHPDPRVRSVAERFSRELGGLASAVEDYKAEWRAVRGLEQLPAPFVHRTRLILAALEQRIRQEAEELYALFGEAEG
ncbi:MAG: hemerythrin domain-containing protein [Deferrisomatales bacterium]|nr:hemerythrin domain-containing protein [Deferrisomatales bacterium]